MSRCVTRYRPKFRPYRLEIRRVNSVGTLNLICSYSWWCARIFSGCRFSRSVLLIGFTLFGVVSYGFQHSEYNEAISGGIRVNLVAVTAIGAAARLSLDEKKTMFGVDS